MSYDRLKPTPEGQDSQSFALSEEQILRGALGHGMLCDSSDFARYVLVPNGHPMLYGGELNIHIDNTVLVDERYAGSYLRPSAQGRTDYEQISLDRAGWDS